MCIGIKMKVAVTYENGTVFQHFGHSKEFKFYEIQDKKIISSEVVSSDGYGHESLVDFLKSNNIEILICGGIGGGAKSALEQASIKLFGGTQGNADDQVDAFLKNELNYNENVSCSHHEGKEHHDHHGNCTHTCH